MEPVNGWWGGGGEGEGFCASSRRFPLSVGAADRWDPPRHRFAAAPSESDRGGSYREGGGGVCVRGRVVLGEGDRIRVCLFQTLLCRKPR